jgi:hypothetical protein
VTHLLASKASSLLPDIPDLRDELLLDDVRLIEKRRLRCSRAISQPSSPSRTLLGSPRSPAEKVNITRGSFFKLNSVLTEECLNVLEDDCITAVSFQPVQAGSHHPPSMVHRPCTIIAEVAPRGLMPLLRLESRESTTS